MLESHREHVVEEVQVRCSEAFLNRGREQVMNARSARQERPQLPEQPSRRSFALDDGVQHAPRDR